MAVSNKFVNEVQVQSSVTKESFGPIATSVFDAGPDAGVRSLEFIALFKNP